MTRKNTLQARPGAQSAAKKSHSHGKKTPTAQVPSQTQQPYEQDTKRRIGHFSGAGEPPLMKK